MGVVLVPCALPCHTNKESSRGDHHYSIDGGGGFLHSESSSSSSISSQPSLPSVPSLNPSPISNNLQDIHEILQAHHNCVATLKPYSSSSSSSSYVCSLVIFRNFLFSGSSDGLIRAWSTRPDHVTVLSHNSNIISPPAYNYNSVVATTNSAVKALVVVVDQNQLFSAHQDHKIRVWKIDTNTITAAAKEHDRHKKYFKCIATLPTLKDRFPRVFFPSSYVEIRRHKKCTWVHHADTVSALALSNGGSFLYSASWDRSFKIWRTSDFKCLASVSSAHDDAINAVVVSPTDGAVICTASADKKIKLWKRNITSERKHSLVHVGTLEKHKSAVNALAFSTDGSVLYSGACDRSILVWARADHHGNSEYQYGMAVVGALRGHGKAVLCLAVVANLVCSGSADYSVRVWRRGVVVGDEMSYTCLAVLEGHKRPVKCLTAAIDSNSDDSDCGYNSFLVYSGSLDCDIRIWKIIRLPVC